MTPPSKATTADALRACRRELADALEQQAATGEILRVIARSASDLDPVFSVMAASAARLTDTPDVVILAVEGGRLRHAASVGHFGRSIGAEIDLPLDRSSICGLALADRRTVHVHDLAAVTDPQLSSAKIIQQRYGQRTMIAAPMLRGDVPLGTIAVLRREMQPFTERQIALLEIFADQAVIAIENARLFREREARNRELTEALEQQTATGEILRAIARSTSDVQPVFDTIARAALRLCEASIVNVLTYDGTRLHVGALVGLEAVGEAAARALFPRVPGRDTVSGMAVLTRGVYQIEDVLTDAHFGFKSGADWGLRSALGLPLLRDGQPIGALAICRPQPGPFEPQRIALLRTFADQAVIALENVRLFTEREQRNRELLVALEQQTATSEILRVIARSASDVQPVFDTIAVTARRLCDARSANVLRLHDGRLQLVAAALCDARAEAALRTIWPRAVGRDTAAGRAVLAREVVAVVDVLADPEYGAGPAAAEAGYRSALGVPLLRDGEPIGAITVGRAEPGPLPPALVALIRTFADQAVIAIENARLFKALQDKTSELEVASRHKNAFLANMSHELRTPLNAILGFTRIVLRETQSSIAPKQAENLEKILASARHLVGLINATMDLTRIEAGRIEITPSEVALASLLEDCVRSVEPLVAPGVHLGLRLPAELPPLWLDAAKLQQITINLLGNAAKFTETGFIELRARAADGRIAVEVEDSGIGIPPDKLEAVFEEFEQVDAGHAGTHGTGLGLAIARRLARAMGGELSAVSALGRGSTFTLTLPLRWKPPGEA